MSLGIVRRFSIIKRFITRFYYSALISKNAKSCGKDLRVNAPSYITRSTILGDNVNFNGMMINGGGPVFIGDNFHSGVDCLMITQIHNYDHGEAIPYDASYILKEITIEDNVWLGSRVTIIGNVTIGEGAIIQAGAVVVNDIPKYAIAGGNPAKVFKHRDIEHYESLKRQGKFM